jgi:Protein of unknown function (DUF3154).
MGFDLASITAAGVGATLSGIGGLATSIREAIVGKEVDPTVVAQIELKLQELENQLMLGQMQINLEEAKSESWWVNGWRPYIGWGCGSSLIYSAILRPIMVDIATMFGNKAIFPILDTTITTQVLLALLGVGIMRSYDKKQAPSPAGKE